MKHRLLSFCIVAVLLLSSVTAEELYGKPWVNTDVDGNIPQTKVSLQDDFNLYVNYDWLKENTIPSNLLSYSEISALSEQRKNECLSILQSKKSKSHEQQLCQTLYHQALDWNIRNKNGIKPVLPYIKKMQDVKSLSEYIDLISDKYAIYNSIIYIIYSSTDLMDSNAYLPEVGCDCFFLDDVDFYRNINVDEESKRRLALSKSYSSRLLQKFGYSADDAAKIVDDLWNFELSYVPSWFGTSDYAELDFYSKIYNVISVDEFSSKYPNLPVKKMIENFGADFISKINVCSFENCEIINSVFVEENLELLKNWSILQLIRSSTDYLDRECYNIKNDYNQQLYNTKIVKSDEDIAYQTCNMLNMALGKAWVEIYFPKEYKDDVTDLTKRIIKAFEKRVLNEDWMSEETKKKSLEKINDISFYIGYPDEWKDYSSLNLPKNYKKGSLFDSYILINNYECDLILEKIRNPVNKKEWHMAPQVINAYYSFNNNSINMLAGILGGVFYQYDWPIEKKLAGIGQVIGHELTHGFDAIGSQFDKDGNMKNWWSEQDKKNFDAKNKRVIDYFSKIEVLPGVMNNGLFGVGETVADIGGGAIVLDIAKEYPDFDYELFFFHFCYKWHTKSSFENVMDLALTDSHPLNYIRSNAIVQQYDEFYSTYNIKPGDGMYLAPEDRVQVW